MVPVEVSCLVFESTEDGYGCFWHQLLFGSMFVRVI